MSKKWAGRNSRPFCPISPAYEVNGRIISWCIFRGICFRGVVWSDLDTIHQHLTIWHIWVNCLWQILIW